MSAPRRTLWGVGHRRACESRSFWRGRLFRNPLSQLEVRFADSPGAISINSIDMHFNTYRDISPKMNAEFCYQAP